MFVRLKRLEPLSVSRNSAEWVVVPSRLVRLEREIRKLTDPAFSSRPPAGLSGRRQRFVGLNLIHLPHEAAGVWDQWGVVGICRNTVHVFITTQS